MTQTKQRAGGSWTTVFVVALNTALGLNGCDHDTAGIGYAVR